jgi:superfamily II DNA helicase RecQ
VRKVQALIKALNYDGYYHATAKKDEKLRAFMTRQKKVIVATSALRIKIDIPNIRII